MRETSGILCSGPSKPSKYADGTQALKVQDKGYKQWGSQGGTSNPGVSWVGHGEWGHIDERKKGLSLYVDLVFFMTMLGQG